MGTAILEELQRRSKRIQTWVKVLGLSVIGLVVAPVIYFAITGLVGLIVAAVVGLVAVNLLPVVAMKFANWKLKAIKAEASENPIETMQKVVDEREAEHKHFGDKLELEQAGIDTFANKVVTFKAKYPQDAPKFEEQLAARRESIRLKRLKYIELGKSIQVAKGQIERAQAIWDMSNLALASEAADRATTLNTYQRIRTEVAMDSVINRMNLSFADMQRAMDDAQIQSIEHDPSSTLEVLPSHVKENIQR